MNEPVFVTGTDFGYLQPWIIAGVALYFGVLPILPSLIAGWRYFGKRMGAPAALGALYGSLIAIGLAAVIAPSVYLAGMNWWLAVAPLTVAVAGPVLIIRFCRFLTNRREHRR